MDMRLFSTTFDRLRIQARRVHILDKPVDAAKNQG